VGERISGAICGGYAGFKEHRVVDFDLRLVDRYCVNEFGPMSSGATTIFVKLGDCWQPVWVMNYQGWYDKAVIRFLKRVLLYTYQKGVFQGGRGLNADESRPPLKYRNEVAPDSTFSEFSGYESITGFGDDAPSFGWHRYSGALLIGEPPFCFAR